MKALVVTTNHQLDLQDVPPPTVGEYEALVRIQGCGICGSTDRELIAGTQPYNSDYPAILGHESVGEVVELGAKVRRFRVGDRVTRPAAIFPGESRDGLHSCWGGFAEYGIVRDFEALRADGLPMNYTALRQNVVPSHLSLRDAVLAICLAETASWFWHLPPVGGKDVCVAGTGIAGLSIALWAKLAGARTVIVLGRQGWKLDIAREVAADHGVNVSEEDAAARVRELTGGGADFFMEAVGHSDQLQLAVSMLRRDGTIAIYGVPPGLEYPLTWPMSAGSTHIAQLPTQEHKGYPWVAEMIRRGHVPTETLMTHVWPLELYAEAFAQVEQGNVVKGMLTIG